MLNIASFVAGFFATGLFQNAYNPKLKGIKEISASTRKSII